ncbi:hypothetical protein AVEN_271-1 [Araneus ventricosus]|uniref:Uncharacterized protein n=1 Tax=Araneus ventricosus TaxID=182803 RepID=A0A4Y2CR60_ARAVE|nr:hypothetical protein AVEN_271-1 [Araneus ventricosus]
MSRKTPEPSCASPNIRITPEGGRLTHERFNVNQGRKHGGSSVEPGLQDSKHFGSIKFPEGVIFQQDGAPPLYGNIVREFLDTTFPPAVDRQVCCHDMATTISPLDFYLWGYVKQHVYSESINDINHLKQIIMDVIHSVTPDVLTRVWEELSFCNKWSPHRTALNRYANLESFFLFGEDATCLSCFVAFL